MDQGRENAKIYLQNNQEICQEIEQQVRDKYNLQGGSGKGQVQEQEARETAAETKSEKE